MTAPVDNLLESNFQKCSSRGLMSFPASVGWEPKGDKFFFHYFVGDSPNVIADNENAKGVRQLSSSHLK